MMAEAEAEAGSALAHLELRCGGTLCVCARWGAGRGAGDSALRPMVYRLTWQYARQSVRDYIVGKSEDQASKRGEEREKTTK